MTNDSSPGGRSAPLAGAKSDSQRIDQWLWFARLTKTRTLAHDLVSRGKVRINRVKVERPSQSIRVGDVLTLTIGARVRLISVKGLGTRRGPAVEAQALYEELTPAPDRTKSSLDVTAVHGETTAAPVSAVRPQGAGRPTKRERRAIERLRDRLREC